MSSNTVAGAQTKSPGQEALGLDALWWRRWGSNPRPQACKARALPAELRPRVKDRHDLPHGQ